MILLGDAAHAIPPTAGQGASQVFEDASSLSLLLSKLSSTVKLDVALDIWQKNWVEKIDQVFDPTKRLNNERLPTNEKANLGEGVNFGGN